MVKSLHAVVADAAVSAARRTIEVARICVMEDEMLCSNA
jgi:hypothetical protein